jgi:hypothetical protein
MCHASSCARDLATASAIQETCAFSGTQSTPAPLRQAHEEHHEEKSKSTQHPEEKKEIKIRDCKLFISKCFPEVNSGKLSLLIRILVIERGHYI